MRRAFTSESSNTGEPLESMAFSVFKLGLMLPASIQSFFQSLSVNAALLSVQNKYM